MQNNLNTESQNHRHPEPSLRHPESSLRHPERSEGSQETRNTHINIGRGEEIGIKELADGIKTMYEWYLSQKRVAK